MTIARAILITLTAAFIAFAIARAALATALAFTVL